MITLSHLKCPSCKLLFGFQNTPKILKNCQHTVCINCLKTQQCCPIDSSEINLHKWGLKSFLTNTKILQEIKNEGKINIQMRQDQRLVENVKKEENRNKREKNEQKIQICKRHGQLMNYINKQQDELLCCQCINEEGMKNKEIISYEQLLNQLRNYVDRSYKIYEQINKKSTQISRRNIQSMIENELNKKREKQMYNIRNYFQSLIEKIRNQQRVVLQRLDNKTKSIINQLKQKYDPSGQMNNRQVWIKQIQKLTNTMQDVYNRSGYKQGLWYINKDKRQSKLIQRGEGLLIQLRDKQIQVQNLLQNEIKQLNCLFSNKIFNQIENLCNLETNNKQQIKEQNINLLKIAQLKENTINQTIKSNKLKLFNVYQIQFDLNKQVQSNQSNINQSNKSNINQSNKSNINQSNKQCSKSLTNIFSNKQTLFQQKRFRQQRQCQQKKQQGQSNIKELKEQQNSQQQQDFLLQDTKHKITTNQITFQQNSISQTNPEIYNQNFNFNFTPILNKQQFTPILNKQDSMSALQQQSTIIKINHNQLKTNILTKTKSQDITINFLSKTNHLYESYTKLSNKNISSNMSLSNNNISNLNNNQTLSQLSKTLPYQKQRSPLKSLVTNTSFTNINSNSKLKKLYIPQKYLPIWAATQQDKHQLIDFTGAQLGNKTISQLFPYLSQSQNIKSLKLIRNKLDDSIMNQLLSSITNTNISSLNLSQNNLTQKVLDILQTNKLGNLKSITLSLNKIVYRRVKDRIQKFKEKGVILTV